MASSPDEKKTKSSSLGVTKSITKERAKNEAKPSRSEDKLKEVLEEDLKNVGKTAAINAQKSKDFSAEYDVKHPTDDKMRNKVRSLLQKSLCTDDENVEGSEIVAAAIEEAMFDMFKGNGQPYKQKYRNLNFNLKDKKNSALRSMVLNREIPPSRLINMTSEELANEDLKKERSEILEKFTKEAMPHTGLQASTDQFFCTKCKKRNCTYYQMQTRSADEPLTTFVQCATPACGNRWRF